MNIRTMKRWLRRAHLGLWVFAAFAAAALPARAGGTSAVEVRLVVKVADRNKAADTLVREAEKHSGYFIRKAEDGVTLSVPAGQVEDLMAGAEALGQVIDRRLQREDLGENLLNKQAVLKAKSEVQRQYLVILDQADTDGALAVEKELIKLVAEIETLKGQIRHLRHRAAFARMEVRFDYRDRATPVPDGSSSFAWLNTMNLSDLLKEF